MKKHLFKVHFTKKLLKAQHEKRKLRQKLLQNEAEKNKLLQEELQKADKRVQYSLGILFVAIMLGTSALVAFHCKQITLSVILAAICLTLIVPIIHIWNKNQKNVLSFINAIKNKIYEYKVAKSTYNKKDT